MHRQQRIDGAVPLTDLLHGIDLVIFDFDGVVVDSEVISLSTLREALMDRGIPLTLADVRARFLGTSLATISEFVTEKTGSCDGLAESWQAALYRQFRAGLRPVPHVTAALDGLSAQGLRYCIASSSRFQRIEVALQATQMTTRFEFIFSAEQVDRGKPAPDLFELAARTVGVAPARCLVIEDSPYGIQAAAAAGMRSAGFVGGAHLDGIAAEHAALLRDCGAEAIIASF